MLNLLSNLIVFLFSFQISVAETEIDCSLYDPAKVSEYTSSWMGNDQYYLFEIFQACH